MSDPEIPATPKRTISRRTFLGASAGAAAGVMIVPRHVVGATQARKAPSDTVNVACVGVGGMGFSDTTGVAGIPGVNVVALCDIDDEQMAKLFDSDEVDQPKKDMFGKARKYRDWRRMFDEFGKSIDAVTVTTPDHNHAVIAMAAIKLNKHVYVQKPLTHTIHEARALAAAARERKLATQMGNQGHSKEGARLVCEWIWDGAIGNVTEVHAWTNRPIWPQGIEAPKEIPSCPSTVDWDVWIGPAPYRPYHPSIHPFAWRGLWDFGTGSLGDMGAHILDQPMWALKLGAPTSVQASSTPYTKDYYPWGEVVTFEFPARGDMGPVKLTWSDGGLRPPRPAELEDGRMMGEEGGGCIFRGDKGVLMCSVYGENPRLIPETSMQAYKRPAKTIPRSPGIREEWIEAIKKGGKSTTDFADFAGPLTEVMLLANIAVRFQDKNQKLLWDGAKMEFTNLPEANEFVRTKYRTGWSL